MSLSVRFLLPLSFAAVLVLSLAESGFAASPSSRKNPASKIFVADVEGHSVVSNGERIEDLTPKTLMPAQGVIIETKTEGRNSMVFSNGTGVSLDPLTQLEVKRFLQEPFVPNRSDNEVEPSVSNLLAYVSRGSVAICTSKLVAGSSMNFTTPQASVSVRGRRILIEATETVTKVSLIEGDVTIRGGGEIDMGGSNLRPGQQAIVRQGSPGAAARVEVQEIPAGELSSIERRITAACMARNTVYFDVAIQQPGDEQQITATSVTPPNLPANATISNAVIPATTTQ